MFFPLNCHEESVVGQDPIRCPSVGLFVMIFCRSFLDNQVSFKLSIESNWTVGWINFDFLDNFKLPHVACAQRGVKITCSNSEFF